MKNGGYRIIRKRVKEKPEGTEPAGKRTGSFFTDKVKITVLPEKVKRLAIGFGELNDGLRKAFLGKDINPDPVVDVYQHYEDILASVKETAEGMDPDLRAFYFMKAEKLFREMEKELPGMPRAYRILGKCVEKGLKVADEFIEDVLKAKNNEILPGICRHYEERLKD